MEKRKESILSEDAGTLPLSTPIIITASNSNPPTKSIKLRTKRPFLVACFTIEISPLLFKISIGLFDSFAERCILVNKRSLLAINNILDRCILCFDKYFQLYRKRRRSSQSHSLLKYNVGRHISFLLVQ